MGIVIYRNGKTLLTSGGNGYDGRYEGCDGRTISGYKDQQKIDDKSKAQIIREGNTQKKKRNKYKNKKEGAR